MDVMTRRGWVFGLALVACTADTKSGGQIVDDTGSGSDSGTSSSGDASEGSTGGVDDCIEDPVCGNGRIDVVEECDGADACSACVSAQEPTPMMNSGEFGVVTIAFAPDGSWLATTQAFEAQPIVLRRYDPAGAELWSHELVDLASVRPAVALDPAGNAYVGAAVQAAEGDPVFPWVAAWDAAGAPSWSVLGADEGLFETIAADGARVVVGGGDLVEAGSTSLMRVFDAAGLEQWSLGDNGFSRVDDVAVIGDEIVAMRSRPGITEGNTSVTIARYDLLATERWAVEIAADEPPSIGRWGVVTDGADGSWVFGARLRSPYVVHQDRDGAMLEELGCIGGAGGVVVGLAVGPQSQLALAITAETYVDQNYRYDAWFPVIAGGEIVEATHFDSSTRTAIAFATGWSGDRRLLGWTDGGSEGGPGSSRVLQIP